MACDMDILLSRVSKPGVRIVAPSNECFMVPMHKGNMALLVRSMPSLAGCRAWVSRSLRARRIVSDRWN